MLGGELAAVVADHAVPAVRRLAAVAAGVGPGAVDQLLLAQYLQLVGAVLVCPGGLDAGDARERPARAAAALVHHL